MRSRLFVPVTLALPGLALGAAGLVHPHRLTYATSGRWLWLHLAGLVVFPLVGVALAALVRARSDPLAWLVRLTAYGYAVFYTALDVIYGVGGGYAVRAAGPGPRPEGVNTMLGLADSLGTVGSWSLLVCAVVLTVDALRRRGPSGLPAVALVAGAWLVHTDHIFAPAGVLGMVVLGVTTGWAAWVEESAP